MTSFHSLEEPQDHLEQSGRLVANNNNQAERLDVIYCDYLPKSQFGAWTKNLEPVKKKDSEPKVKSRNWSLKNKMYSIQSD